MWRHEEIHTELKQNWEECPRARAQNRCIIRVVVFRVDGMQMLAACKPNILQLSQ